MGPEFRFLNRFPPALKIIPSPWMGEGWDEGDTPHLNPLPQGERKAFSPVGGAPPEHDNSE